MKNYYRFAFVISIIFIMAGCGSIQIQSPSKDQKYITTPYDLKVKHTGCGEYVSETFKAYLDKGKENEQDITSEFTESGREWIASAYGLPLGSHTLWARADLRRPSGLGGIFCWSLDESDDRQFLVYEPTCIKGTVLGYLRGQDPSEAEPLPDASIRVYRAGTKDLVAEGVSDEKGNYCIDKVPLGILVDIYVEQTPFSGHKCSGQKDDIDTGLTPNICPNCIVVDIIAVCYAI